MYCCPKCNSASIDVNISAWAALLQDDPDNIQTDMDEAGDHHHDWDDESLMRCRQCGHMARAGMFQPQNVEAEETAAEGTECSDCVTVVTPDDPYFATPCGTYCDSCMATHVEKCGVCSHEFGDEFEIAV